MTVAHYLKPIKPGHPLRAGLMPLGTDFGNGEVDGHYFQRDEQAEHYLAEKRALDSAGQPRRKRYGLLADTDAQRRAHEVVIEWIRATLAREHPQVIADVDAMPASTSPYEALALNVQEDLVVIQRAKTPEASADGNALDREAADNDALIMTHVCFPSSWPSDQVLGYSFRRVHGPVPGFADNPVAAASMVNAMVDRGPYTRFAWTLAADDQLDHHPTRGSQRPWQRDQPEAWLRLERQVTVPFPEVSASLFLIRIYRYALSSLNPDERARLREAIVRMPESARRYKQIDKCQEQLMALL
ncbi:MAG: DUF3445 domain-containing protein [Haliangiales bacterium]